MERNPTGTIFNRTKQYIPYAVDVLISGRWVRTIDEAVTQIKEAAVCTGLVINDTKQVHENKQKYNKFRATDGHVFEGVQNFRLTNLKNFNK
jgi:hypothetical protein